MHGVNLTSLLTQLGQLPLDELLARLVAMYSECPQCTVYGHAVWDSLIRRLDQAQATRETRNVRDSYYSL